MRCHPESANSGRDDPAQDAAGSKSNDPGFGVEANSANDSNGGSASADENDEETPASNSYALLLQSLTVANENAESPRKRRKTSDKNAKINPLTDNDELDTGSISEIKANADNVEEEPLELAEEAEIDDEEGAPTDVDSESEETLMHDPYEKHFATISEQDLKTAVEEVVEKHWETFTSTVNPDIRRTSVWRKHHPPKFRNLSSAQDISLKQRLVHAATVVLSTTSDKERTVAASIFDYTDILYGCRNIKNASRLRDISCLHALNHVFKTRDRVLKNNAKLGAESGDALDLRDQGFTRPKVLIIIPTKQACVKFVDSITRISEPDQQENKARFLETYSHNDEDEWLDKPDDFRELFGGNHEEDFRIGLKFTRKTIKYFSGFYNSDIIIGSPLGLMRTITTTGGGKDTKKVHNADFLSSIEIVVMDHANALQMQNWQHVDYVFSQLNLLPKDSHGCDFSRVRHWYLDGEAKYLRQTIIFSDYLTPEINALASTYSNNISGRVKYLPTYPGAMLAVSSLPIQFPLSIPQTFLRIPSPNPLTDSDARFKYFTTAILPPLIRDARHQKGVLLFVPTYADFACLRNHLSTSSDATSLSFGTLSEYTPVKDVMRARSHFLSGRHALLLYSERAHHHFRYRLRGVKKLLWYGVPENPIFWAEIISLLGLRSKKDEEGLGRSGSGKGNMRGVVRALFSKWDALKLERIVGTERVGRLIHDRGGDTFEFI